MRRILWLLLGVCAILAGCNLDPLPSVPGTPVWSMQDGNPARTFHVADLQLEKPPKLLWRRRFLRQKDPDHLIDAVVADQETLYLICRVDEWRKLRGSGQRERMYAISVRLADGKELWRYGGPDLRGKAEYAGSLQEGKLFLVTEKGMLVLDSRTGQLLKHLKKDWSPLPGYPRSVIVEAPKNRAYVAGKEGEVRCLNLIDGEELWSTKAFAGWPDVDRLTLHGDTLIVVVCGDVNGIAALDTADGRILWCRSPAPRVGLFGKTIPTYPSVAGGKALVVGAGGSLIAFIPTYYLMALDLNTGRMVWKSKDAYSNPASDGQRAYVAGMKRMKCLDLRSGWCLWRTRRIYPRGAVVSGNTVLVPCQKGLLRGISANKGKVLWAVRVDKHVSRLAVAGKYIVVVPNGLRSVWVFTPSDGGPKEDREKFDRSD